MTVPGPRKLLAPAEFFVKPPPSSRSAGQGARHSRRRAKIDFDSRDSRNRELGLAGEKYVVAIERKRLIGEKRSDLAKEVVHVSLEFGDGSGYDIKSFTARGEPLYIEVKTTTSDSNQPFMMSANELKFARGHKRGYRLIRVFDWGATPRAFILKADGVKRLNVIPTNYRCSV